MTTIYAIGRLDRFGARAAIAVITIYKRLVSPLLPRACRFIPSCSDYAVEALSMHGMVRGGSLALRRLLKCHPLGGSGWDPVR